MVYFVCREEWNIFGDAEVNTGSIGVPVSREKKVILFRSCMYVLELHPLTGVPFHEREDEAYAFKV